MLFLPIIAGGWGVPPLEEWVVRVPLCAPHTHRNQQQTFKNWEEWMNTHNNANSPGKLT